MNQKDLAFVLRYCWECTNEPFTGSATEQLHAMGLGHGDMLPVFTELKCGLEEIAPPEVPIPWKTKAQFRDQMASLIYEHKQEKLAADLKRLHERWVQEEKVIITEKGRVYLQAKVLPELEECWDKIDGETKGKMFALFMLHVQHDGYPCADVALYAVFNKFTRSLVEETVLTTLRVAEEFPEDEPEQEKAEGSQN